MNQFLQFGFVVVRKCVVWKFGKVLAFAFVCENFQVLLYDRQNCSVVLQRVVAGGENLMRRCSWRRVTLELKAFFLRVVVVANPNVRCCGVVCVTGVVNQWGEPLCWCGREEEECCCCCKIRYDLLCYGQLKFYTTTMLMLWNDECLSWLLSELLFFVVFSKTPLCCLIWRIGEVCWHNMTMVVDVFLWGYITRGQPATSHNCCDCWV